MTVLIEIILGVFFSFALPSEEVKLDISEEVHQEKKIVDIPISEKCD